MSVWTYEELTLDRRISRGSSTVIEVLTICLEWLGSDSITGYSSHFVEEEFEVCLLDLLRWRLFILGLHFALGKALEDTSLGFSVEYLTLLAFVEFFL